MIISIALVSFCKVNGLFKNKCHVIGGFHLSANDMQDGL